MQQLVRSGYIPAPKLIYPRAYARTTKVILLDADTAFFRRPDMLVNWMADKGGTALYLHDHRRDDRDEAPVEVKKHFLRFRGSIPHGDRWSLPHFYFNSGLLAFEPHALDFDVAEAFLDWNRNTPPELQAGTAGIWFGPWTPEQAAYMMMYAYLEAPARPFPREYRLEEPENGVFCHFLRSGLRRNDAMQRLQDVVAELP